MWFLPRWASISKPSQKIGNRWARKRNWEPKRRMKLLKGYGFCIVAELRERIANLKTEPPGLFRSCGNHPKLDMLKRQIMPKDIIITCTKDAQVPSHSPLNMLCDSGLLVPKSSGHNFQTWILTSLLHLTSRPSPFHNNTFSRFAWLFHCRLLLDIHSSDLYRLVFSSVPWPHGLSHYNSHLSKLICALHSNHYLNAHVAGPDLLSSHSHIYVS